MKKTILYLSFFVAAFLVSCKSNEAPVVEETTETPQEVVQEVEEVVETVVEEPVQEKTPSKETTKKPKDPVMNVESKPATSAGKTGGKVKETEVSKEITNSTEEKAASGRPSKVKASIENKE